MYFFSLFSGGIARWIHAILCSSDFYSLPEVYDLLQVCIIVVSFFRRWVSSACHDCKAVSSTDRVVDIIIKLCKLPDDTSAVRVLPVDSS